MPELKLAKLPDRKPVKLTITLQPETNSALQAYAAAYREAYGEEEEVAELIPYMIDSFLSADRGFAKVRRNGSSDPPSAGRRPKRQQRDQQQ
ncbi:MAG: DUF2274 domain-containing protein [Alphaproteobacteria bacterium]|nr:DUF2274 domain-containing protein [Alphaproteobacteria bacterium]